MMIRKPPKATRFKPGRSGNPRGRTKRSKNGRTLLEETLNEIVVVSEAGVPQRMTKREAFFKSLVARALKDNRFAMLLIKTMERYDVMLADDSPSQLTIEFVTPPRPPRGAAEVNPIRIMVRFLRRDDCSQGQALTFGGVAETFVALNRGPRVWAMEIWSRGRR
jgi:hypothetical protein